MTAWRRGSRFELRQAEGVLRVLCDVIVQRDRGGELFAIGLEPGLPGEMVLIHTVNDKTGVPVRVEESRPVIVDGIVRHRLRLAPVDPEHNGTIHPTHMVVRRGTK